MVKRISTAIHTALIHLTDRIWGKLQSSVSDLPSLPSHLHLVHVSSSLSLALLAPFNFSFAVLSHFLFLNSFLFSSVLFFSLRPIRPDEELLATT